MFFDWEWSTARISFSMIVDNNNNWNISVLLVQRKLGVIIYTCLEMSTDTDQVLSRPSTIFVLTLRMPLGSCEATASNPCLHMKWQEWPPLPHLCACTINLVGASTLHVSSIGKVYKHTQAHWLRKRLQGAVWVSTYEWPFGRVVGWWDSRMFVSAVISNTNHILRRLLVGTRHTSG